MEHVVKLINNGGGACAYIDTGRDSNYEIRGGYSHIYALDEFMPLRAGESEAIYKLIAYNPAEREERRSRCCCCCCCWYDLFRRWRPSNWLLRQLILSLCEARLRNLAQYRFFSIIELKNIVRESSSPGLLARGLLKCPGDDALHSQINCGKHFYPSCV